MAETVILSQGNSFACTFVWTPGTTGPANLTATTISSTVEDKCGNAYDLTVTKSLDGLSFTCAYIGSTSNWAIGLGKWDIKFVFPGSPAPISRTEIFRVQVVESVTQ